MIYSSLSIVKYSFTKGFDDFVILVVLKLINNPCGRLSNFIYIRVVLHESVEYFQPLLIRQ